MGLLKKRKALNILKSVGLGLLDTVSPLKPFIAGAKEAFKSNKNSETGGKGKIDYLRLTVAIVTLLGVIGLLAGWIDFETLKNLIKLVN